MRVLRVELCKNSKISFLPEDISLTCPTGMMHDWNHFALLYKSHNKCSLVLDRLAYEMASHIYQLRQEKLQGQ